MPKQSLDKIVYKRAVHALSTIEVMCLWLSEPEGRRTPQVEKRAWAVTARRSARILLTVAKELESSRRVASARVQGS